MKKGCNVVSGLSTFFKAYKKLNESYTMSVIKLLEPLMIDVQDDSSTLEIAMDSLYASIKLSLIKSQDFCKNMQIEIINFNPLIAGFKIPPKNVKLKTNYINFE